MALLKLKFVTDLKNMDYEVVEFHGELDKSTLPNAENQISKLVEAFDGKTFICDFSGLNFINSEGVGFLVSMHSKLCKKNRAFVLADAKPNILDILNVVGLPKIIPVFDSLSLAIESVNKQ
jgi:anti-anti-sigma factor